MSKKNLFMLTTNMIIFLVSILITIETASSFQNPTFKDDNVILYYVDRPRHYSERADSVKIHLINEATNYEKTLDLTIQSSNVWSISIPLSYLYRSQGITDYTYYYYFIVDGRKILDPTNRTRTMPYVNGIEGRVSFFNVEHKRRTPTVITQNPEIISSGMIFYYTREVSEHDVVKLIISKENTTFSRVYTFEKNEEGILVSYVDKNHLPEKNIYGRYYYKFIVNDKYMLDTLNPNQVKSKIGGVFNLVEIRDPALDTPSLPVNPLIKDEGLFFFLNAPDAKQVGLITDMNGWQEVLPMGRSNDPRYKGAWVIMLSKKNKHMPLTSGTYRYKFIVDGVITHDVNNPTALEDGVGGKVSAFRIEKPLTHYDKSPLHVKGNIYRFFFMSRSAKHVFIVGTFNNWNPFSHKMKRVNEDLFVIDIELHPSTYFYSFSVDSKLMHDPRNTEVAYNQIGQRVSVANLSPPERRLR